MPPSGNVALVPPAFAQEGVEVEWRFWRGKVDSVTGKGMEAHEYVMSDLMDNIVWVKDTGTTPIPKIKVKFLTTAEDYRIANVPSRLMRFVPSRINWQREWEVNLEPGQEKTLHEVKTFEEWVMQDMELVGAEITSLDPHTLTGTANMKLGPIHVKGIDVYFSTAKSHTTGEIFISNKSYGKSDAFDIVFIAAPDGDSVNQFMSNL